MATEQVGQTQLRPFHETVAEYLQDAPWPEMLPVLRLLTTTKIPAGHDAILAALEGLKLFNFRERNPETGEENDWLGLAKASILVQKEAAVANELSQGEVERVVTILNDRCRRE